MKSILEICEKTKKQYAIDAVEALIKQAICLRVGFANAFASNDLPLDELIYELESANYVIFMKKEDHVVIDLVESQIKQGNEDE